MSRWFDSKAEQVSATEWRTAIACGEWDIEIDIEATDGGLVVNYELVTWEQIDAARKVVMEEGK